MGAFMILVTYRETTDKGFVNRREKLC